MDLDKIIIISIISVTALIACLFIAVNIRRLVKYLSYRKLDIARENYEVMFRQFLQQQACIDYNSFNVKKNSTEWKAIEDVLFHAITDKRATEEVVTQIFDRLGYVETYIEDLVKGKKHRRALAADKLGRLKAPQATEYLIGALNDHERDVRTVAARSLGKIRDLRAVEPLIDKLVLSAQDPQLLPLRVVKTSITNFYENAFPFLIPILKHSSWRVRGQAADIIGEISDSSTVRHLLPMLGDTEPDVRIKAVKALGKIKRSDAFQPMARMIDDPSWIVRLQVAKTLGNVGGSQAVPHLVELLSDLYWQVREAAVKTISSLGSIANPELLKALLLLKDRYAREQVIEVLLTTEILNNQFDMLCSADLKDRETASLLLVAAGNCGAWDIIAKAVREHKNPRVRRMLVHVIKLIVNDDAENILRMVSENDSDRDVREAACSAIENASLCL
ncbi:MAG: HEAT repeat domain-containing protein [Nitrospirae bacterium]|nr:HEAT repeat domain-containing protein [Nitrospirota bacterium]